MTFEQSMRAELDSYALFPAMIDGIIAMIKSDPANIEMAHRWNDDVAHYPPAMLSVMRLTLKTNAVEYMKANHPKAWMIPALEEMA